MSRYDVLIVGAGLGGLECAYILAKKGLSVCVVEKETQVGGCLQMFRRRGHAFDTGFHYVGGLGDGEPLGRLFSYFGLTELPWVRMEAEAFDEVTIKGRQYLYANGFDNFASRMADYFPRQRDALRRYVRTLKEVYDNIEHSFDPRSAEDVYTQSAFARPAYGFLKEVLADDEAIDAVSGASLKMELDPETLPLYIFAQINASFISSAWRLRGGGGQICEHLADSVRRMGGTVMTGCGAAAFIAGNDRLSAVRLTNGELIEAGWFISGIHPAATMRLLDGCPLIRRVYRNRITRMENTTGMFTVNCEMQEEAVPYFNRNRYIYETSDIWKLCRRAAGAPVEGVMVSCQPPEDGTPFTRNIDILTTMPWAEVEQWAGTRPMKRGEDYEEMKRGRAEECLAFAERYMPGLRDAVKHIYTSTPLTYADYTATADGSAYGIKKDCNNLMYTLLTPRTPISNLLLTGQNLNLHGILGVSMTSFMTCAWITGPVNPFKE